MEMDLRASKEIPHHSVEANLATLGDEECEPHPHVEVAVRFFLAHRTMLPEKVENRQLPRQLLNDVGERLRCTHQLAPAVASDIHRIVDIDASVEAILDQPDIDMGRIKERLAIGAAIVERGEVALRQLFGDLLRHREPIGMDAGTLDEDYSIAMSDVPRADEPLLGLHEPHGRAGEYDRARYDHAFERRRLTAPPGASSHITGLLPASNEVTAAILVGKPI